MKKLVYSWRYLLFLVRLAWYHTNRTIRPIRPIRHIGRIGQKKRLRTAGIAAALLLLILAPAIYISLRSAKTAHAWWDERYLYRQPVSVTYSAAETLSDYQVRVTVNTSTLISAGKMKTDCGDIRFYEENYGERSYWIEDSTCNTATTYVWVKMGKIEKGGKTIWLYYGNNNGAAQSSISDTMIFGDDFTGTTINTSKWDETDTGSNVSQSGQIVIANGTGVWGETALFTDSTFTRSNIEMRYKFKAECERGATYHITTMIGWKDTTAGVSYSDMPYADYWHRFADGTSNLIVIYEDGNNRGTVGAVDCNTQYWGKTLLKPTGADYYLSTDNSNWSSLYTSTYSTESPLKLGFTHYQGGDNLIDEVFVRQYAATEPTTSVGSEQKSVGPVLFLTFDEGSGEIAHNEMGPQIAPNPVGWWKMDEAVSGNCTGTVTDSGDGQADGTCSNTPTYTTGKIGGALNFNGTSQAISLSDSSKANITGDISVSAWIKPTTLTQTDNIIIHKDQQYSIDIRTSDRYVAWADSSNWSFANFGYKDIGITLDTWQLITVTKTGGVVKIYLNGQEKVSQSFGSALTSTANTAFIGCYAGASSCSDYYFPGALDNVKVYNSALTAAQVYNEYAETNAYFQPVPTGGPTWKNYPESPDHPKTVSLDGSNDVIRVPHSTTLNLGNSGDSYSISLWLKNNGYVAPLQDAIIGKSDNSTGYPTPFLLLINSSNGITARAGTTTNYVNLDSNKNGLNDNHWHHVELVRSNDTLALYIDGRLDSQSTGTIDDSRNTAQITIGTYADTGPSGNQFFKGEVDNIKIYNYARSTDQIKLDYNNPCPGGCGVKLGAQITADGMPTPTGYWKLDDGSGQVAQDSSPNGNNGTLGSSTASDTNDPTWTSGGKVGGGLSFDGTDDYVNVGDPADGSLDFGTGNFTIAAWIKTTYRSLYRAIATKTNNTTNNGFSLRIDTSSHYPEIILDDNVSYKAKATHLVDDDSWHYVAGIRSGNNLYIYVDGVLSNSISGVSAVDVSGTESFNIGRVETVASGYWNGSIDEVKAYNSALTQEQIMLEYSNKKPVLELGMDEGSGEVVYNSQGTTVAPNPVGWWKMDEATSGDCTGTVYDYGSGGNNGSCQNTVPYVTGKIGGALNFNGAGSDYVDAGTSTGLNFSQSSSFSISSWIQTSSNTEFITSKMRSSGSDIFGYETLVSASGKYVFQLDDANQAFDSVASLTSVNDNQWHFVTSTYDGTTLKVYVDGKFENSTARTITTSGPPTNEFVIGVRHYDATYANYFTGIIDNVKVWNSTLTPAQAYAEYAETNAYFQPSVTGGPTWKAYAESPEHPKTLSFDGSNDYLNIPDQDLPVNTVSFWVKPNSTTESIVDLDGGTHTVTFSTGSLTATGWTSPTYYVNGVQGRAVTAGVWQLVTITTATQFTAADIDIGRVSSTYFTGEVDNFKIYNYARSVDEIKVDYNNPCPGGCGVKLGAQITADGMPTPTGYWKLDDGAGQKAIDSSPNANNGTLGSTTASDTNDPTWTSGGKVGSALDFDGTSDYVKLPDNAFDSLTQGSYSAWVKIDNTTSAFSFTQGSSTSDNPYLGMRFETGYFQVSIRNSSLTTLYAAKGNTYLANGQWHHVVWKVDSGGNALYVDGRKETVTYSAGSASSTYFFSTLASTTNTYSMGVLRRPNIGYYFDGGMDEVKIYSSALTPEQIMLDYSNKKPILELKMNENSGEIAYDSQGTVIAPNPVGWWKMDEATSGNCTGTVNDYGSGGNNATCYNTVPYAVGAIGGSLNFDGSADYVNITTLNGVSAGDSLTISTWFNASAVDATQNIITDGDDTTNFHFRLEIGADNKLHAYFGDGTSWGDTTSGVSSSTITASQWYHAAAILNTSTDTAYLYLNNVLQASWSETKNTGTISGLVIGDYITHSGTYNFPGKIDHFKIWNSALTGAQIAAEYKETNAYLQNMDAASDWVVSPYGRALSFDGSNDYLNIPDQDLPVNTVSFWVKPNSTTESIVDLDGGTHTVTFASGSLTATGWSSPTYYVNGVQGRAVTAGVWQLVTITTATQFTAADIDIGRVSSTYFTGDLDNFKIYNYVRSAAEIKEDFNNGAAKFN